MTNWATDYANQVISGAIVACKYVKLACKRHNRDLKNKDYVFDLNAANKAIDFCEFLTHYKGEKAGEVFEPELWQKFILASLFGWKLKRNGKRRFRYAYVEVPRKNGKSFMCAGLALFLLTADGASGPEVYSVATKEDQAKIVWKDSAKMIKYSEDLQEFLRKKVKVIECEDNDGEYTPLGADSETLDGLNPHGVICDELHAWKSRDLWDVIEDAFGSRPQPMHIAITTAGYNQNGICYEQREHLINILENPKGYVDETYFGIIYTVDDKKKWKDPLEWQKANPNLEVSKSVDFMHDQCNKATLMPTKENAFKNKQLNIWTNAAVKWLDMDKWDACGGDIDINALRGSNCIIGLDMASTEDFTASVKVFPPSVYDRYIILPRFYIPQESLDPNFSKRKRQLLDIIIRWEKLGFIVATPGNMTDDSYIVKDIEADAELFNVTEIAFDPYNARQIAVSLEKKGFEMVQFNQTIMNYTEPTKKFSAYVNAKKFLHDNNPVLRWMAGNTVVRSDANDNQRPDKANCAEKIDGIAGGIMGFGRLLSSGEPDESVYEERGIRSI